MKNLEDQKVDKEIQKTRIETVNVLVADGELPGWRSKCPARGQTRKKCKKKDHFASTAKTKPRKPGVNQVQEEHQSNREEVDNAFRVTNEAQSKMLKLSVGGVELEMLVDSGATNNIVDKCTWEDLKAQV